MGIIFSYEDADDRTLAFAAGEAGDYIRRMLPDTEVSVQGGTKRGDTAPDWEIVLAVEPDGEPKDHFEIHAADGKGRIAGNHSRSVLIGVYHYLYLLGCRFLGPGKGLERVPRLGSADALAQDCSHTAGYYHRGVCIEGAESLENILDFVDWLPKIGYNTCFIQFQLPYTFLARWYQHEGNAHLEPEELTVEMTAAYTKRIVAEMKKRDLLLQQVGHGWTGESIGIPSMDWKAASYELSGRQRAMLAEVGGVRGFYHGIPMNTNLCYSKPEVVEAFSECVVRYAQVHPEVDYLHVWLADECNNICECEECRKAIPTDQYVHILNVIDRKLTERELDTKIVFLLYQELLWPPKKEKLENPDRFVLMFAPISRSFNSSYQLGGELPAVEEYRRNRIQLPVNVSQNMAYLKAWQEHFTGDSFVYDYHLGRAHYGDFGYVHISRILCEDIAQLGRMGLNGHISCQEMRAGLPNFLPNYVMGRKLFDLDCTFEELAEEYYQAAYGEDWKEVYTYLSGLSSLCSCDYFNNKGSRTDAAVAADMKKAREMTAAFAASESMAKERKDPVCAEFWRVLKYHCRVAAELEAAVGYLAEGKTEEAAQAWNRFSELICENELSFQPYLDVYRIREVSLNFTGFRRLCGCGK